MASLSLSKLFQDEVLAGLASHSNGAIKLKGKTARLKFDEIVVRRIGPSLWAADLYWKGQKTVSLSESIFLAEGSSISFKCISGQVPFNLTGV